MGRRGERSLVIEEESLDLAGFAVGVVVARSAGEVFGVGLLRLDGFDGSDSLVVVEGSDVIGGEGGSSLSGRFDGGLRGLEECFVLDDSGDLVGFLGVFRVTALQGRGALELLVEELNGREEGQDLVDGGRGLVGGVELGSHDTLSFEVASLLIVRED